jgi:integrase
MDRIRGVLSRAVEWGFLIGHPMRAVKRAKGDDNTRIRYLSTAEENRLREALAKRETKHRKERISYNAHQAKRGKEGLPLWPADAFTDHLSPMVLLAINTGLRRGELFGIQWSNVNLPGKVLTIPAGIAKSRKPRHIPLNAEAHDVLTRWKPKGVEPDALVFPSIGGGRFNNINKSWAAVAEAAKLEDFRFHDIRHSFASRLVMAGVDLNVVRELLGHADIAMTLRYSHLAPGKLADAVQKLEVRK